MVHNSGEQESTFSKEDEKIELQNFPGRIISERNAKEQLVQSDDDSKWVYSVGPAKGRSPAEILDRPLSTPLCMESLLRKLNTKCIDPENIAKKRLEGTVAEIA